MNDKKNLLQTIREQEMDRKSFLKMSGLVLLSLFGAGAIVKLLTPVNSKETANVNTDVPKGFGSGKYGI